MLFLKQAPVGVDIPIQKMQEYLHCRLPGIWGIGATEYSAFGRCYRNQKDDGHVAEVYMGNGEYQEAYADDRKAALSFFGLSGDTEVEIGYTAFVHLIFFVNLNKIKPAISHRGDEEARVDVVNLVKGGNFGFSLTAVSTGIERVLQEYGGTTIAERSNLSGLYGRDMHPYHCFRFDFDLKYSKNC